MTDSTACIPPEEVRRHGIEVVPLHIIFGGRTFTDSLAEDSGDFYRLVRAPAERPTTAAPSPGMFVEAFARASRTHDQIVCITVSQQFSAMQDAARHAMSMAAAESSGLEIRLVDSRNAAMAQGFVVLEAARAARAGAGVDEVVARATEMAERVSLVAMLDTLSYLARGGRVPRVAAWAAGMLQVKPIVRFSAADIRLAARTRTRSKARERLADVIAADAGGGAAHVAVHHADAAEDARWLAGTLQARLRIAELYVTEFTQVMAVHTGPGLLGAAFWTE